MAPDTPRSPRDDPPGTRRASAYCSATDRNVPVLVRLAKKRRRRRHPSYSDAAERLVCLDYGVRCTGWLCPLFDVPALPAEEGLTDPAHPGPN